LLVFTLDMDLKEWDNHCSTLRNLTKWSKILMKVKRSMRYLLIFYLA